MIQIFPVRGEPARNYRHALHRRVESFKIGKTAFEMLAVVYVLAEDDLPVHRDAGVGKAAHYVHHLSRVFVFHHENAQLRFRRMDGNIDRRKVHLTNAVYLTV